MKRYEKLSDKLNESKKGNPTSTPLNPFIVLPMDLERRYVILDFERKGWFTTVKAEYSVIYSKPMRYMVRYSKTGLFRHTEEKVFLNQAEALRHFTKVTL